MLFLRTLLIFALGISVVAAIPVSPMTSSIHRRDPWFREAVEKALGKAPKLPSTDEEAERRLSGLWVQLIDVLVKAPKGLGVSTYKMPYYVYMRITNNEVLQIWSDPKVTLPPDILYSTDGWAREQKGAIKDMIKYGKSDYPAALSENVENMEAEFRKDVIVISRETEKSGRLPVRIKLGWTKTYRNVVYLSMKIKA